MATRILMLAPQPFFRVRGMCLAQLGLLHVLSELGAEVEVLTLPGGEDTALPPGVELRRLWSPPGLRPPPIGPSLRKLAWNALLLPAAAARLLVGGHQIVLASEESAFLAAALKPFFGFRLVYDMDEVLSERLRALGWLRGRAALGLLRAAERRVLRSADAILTNSADTTLAASRAAGPGKVFFYHHAPDGAPGVPPQEDGAELVYAGNLEPYQGVELLLRALAELRARGRGARLDVIGGRPEQARALSRLADGLGVGPAVRWLGARPLHETLARLARARALAAPMTQDKALPMKLYAYMGSGVPIVATRLPSHTQLLDEGCALLCAPEPLAFAEGLRRALEEPALGARLAAEAARRLRALELERARAAAVAAACALAPPRALSAAGGA